MSTPCHDPEPRTLDMLCTKCGKPWESYEFAGRTHMSPSCRCTYASGEQVWRYADEIPAPPQPDWLANNMREIL